MRKKQLMQYIVISYASENAKVALQACRRLEAARVKCWIAPRDVAPGSDYAESIMKGIEGSAAMLIILSSDSMKSPHVKREVERAVSKGITIIPFVIERVKLTPAMEYYISSQHWLDAADGAVDKHLPRLLETAKAILKQRPSAAPESPEGRRGNVAVIAGSPAPEKKARFFRPWMLFAGAAAIVAIAVATMLFWGVNTVKKNAGTKPDNAQVAGIPLKYDPSRMTQVGSRLSLAVLPFTGVDLEEGIAKEAGEKVIATLSSLRRFRIIPPKQVDLVMLKRGQRTASIGDSSIVQAIGIAAQWDAVMYGSVEKDGKDIVINANVMDIASGAIISRNKAQDRFDRLSKAAAMVAVNTFHDLPLAEGFIVEYGGKHGLIDLGTGNGLREGMRLVVYREGQPITHPVTNEVLGKEVRKVGEMTVDGITDAAATFVVISREPGKDVERGDRVLVK